MPSSMSLVDTGTQRIRAPHGALRKHVTPSCAQLVSAYRHRRVPMETPLRSFPGAGAMPTLLGLDSLLADDAQPQLGFGTHFGREVLRAAGDDIRAAFRHAVANLLQTHDPDDF